MIAALLPLLLARLWPLGCSGGGDPAPPGVIVVSIDTLRADAVTPEEAPFLAGLAAESVAFDRAYAAANETLFSHGALFASQLPSHIAPLDYDFALPRDAATLAGAFTAAGWRTGAVVGSGHLARVFGLDVGFTDYVEGRWWGSFQQTIPLALRWLDAAAQGDQPFFLFLHGYDCHVPYAKPGPLGRSATPGYQGPLLAAIDDHMMFERIYKDRFFPQLAAPRLVTQRGQGVLDPGIYAQLQEQHAQGEGLQLTDADLAFLDGLYDTAVFYADLQMELLFAALEERGLLATTTVVVLSDHGEELLDHGFLSHRTSLHDSATAVPLLVRIPGVEPRRISAPASLIDVAPTLLSLSGVPVPDAMEGRDLSACIRSSDCPKDSVGVSEGVMDMVSVSDGRHRLIVEGMPAEDPGLTDALRAGGAGLTLRLYEGDQPVQDPAAQARLLNHLVWAREAE